MSKCPACAGDLHRNEPMRWVECECGYIQTDELRDQAEHIALVAADVEAFDRGEWSFTE